MPEVTDNAALSRYEMVADGVTAFVTYAWHGDRLTLVHTEVPQALARLSQLDLGFGNFATAGCRLGQE
jgi:hypothetical protein